jgi:hypothetical protein
VGASVYRVVKVLLMVVVSILGRSCRCTYTLSKRNSFGIKPDGIVQVALPSRAHKLCHLACNRRASCFSMEAIVIFGWEHA